MNEALIQQFVRERRQHLGFLRVLTRDPELAEELFQELSVAVIGQAASFDASRDFGAWVRGIARNLYRNALRKRRVTAPLDPAVIDAIDVAYENQAESEREERGVQLARLNECLETLPAQSRELLLDRYERNLSASRMAESRASTPGAIDTALCRIRAALLNCIQRRSRQEGLAR